MSKKVFTKCGFRLCENKFEKKRAWQKYCSRECRHNEWAMRHTEKLTADAVKFANETFKRSR